MLNEMGEVLGYPAVTVIKTQECSMEWGWVVNNCAWVERAEQVMTMSDPSVRVRMGVNVYGLRGSEMWQ